MNHLSFWNYSLRVIYEKIGIIETNKLSLVDFNRLAFNFSKWHANFNTRLFAKDLALTHIIKVEFVNTSSLFCNMSNLIQITNKIGEVLEIKH